MSPNDHATLNTALLGLLAVVCTAVGTLLIAYFNNVVKIINAKTDAQIQAITGRQDRQSVKLDNLANGEGDKKIQLNIKSAIADGILHPGKGLPLVDAGPAQTNRRASDKANVIHADDEQGAKDAATS